MPYFIDQKLLIDYQKISYEFSLSSVRKDIFILIINNSSPEVKYTLLSNFLYPAIINQNIELVEYLLSYNPPHEDALIESVKTNKIEIVNVVLKHDSKPSFINKKSKDGTALEIAVKRMNLQIVQRLLSLQGINPNLYCQSNSTPLIHAINFNSFDIVNEILDFYENKEQSQINQFNKALQATLNLISLADNEIYYYQIVSVMKRILEIKNINPNCCNDNDTLLSFFCEVNEIEMVKILLSKDNIDVNASIPKNGNTPLLVAIIQKNIEISELLINDKRTDINIKNFENQSPLIQAVSNHLGNIVSLLLKHEAFDPEESNINYAFFISSGKISKQLLNSNYVDVNYNHCQIEYHDFIFESTLNKAVKQKDLKKIDLIIENTSFDKDKSHFTSSLLHTIQTTNAQTFKKLFNFASNSINCECIDMEFLFNEAVIKQNIEIMSEIFNNINFESHKKIIVDTFINVSVNAKRPSFNIMETLYEFDKLHDNLINLNGFLPNGKTFFTSIKSKFDSEELVNFFLRNGADPNIPDKNNVYPLEYALSLNDKNFINALLDSGKVDFTIKISNKIQTNKEFITNAKYKTYLHLAAQSKINGILQSFLTRNLIDINVTDDLGETPLMDACRYNRKENINLLLGQKGIDYYHCNNEGLDVLNIELPSEISTLLKESIPLKKSANKTFNEANEKKDKSKLESSFGNLNNSLPLEDKNTKTGTYNQISKDDHSLEHEKSESKTKKYNNINRSAYFIEWMNKNRNKELKMNNSNSLEESQTTEKENTNNKSEQQAYSFSNKVETLDLTNEHSDLISNNNSISEKEESFSSWGNRSNNLELITSNFYNSMIDTNISLVNASEGSFWGGAKTQSEIEVPNSHDAFASNQMMSSFSLGSGLKKSEQPLLTPGNKNGKTPEQFLNTNQHSFTFGSTNFDPTTQSMYNLFGNQTTMQLQFGNGNTESDQSLFPINNDNNKSETLSNKSENNEITSPNSSSFHSYSNKTSFTFGSGNTEQDQSQFVNINENIEAKPPNTNSFSSYSNQNSFHFGGGSFRQEKQSMYNSFAGNQTTTPLQSESGNTKPDQSQFVINNVNNIETMLPNKNENSEIKSPNLNLFNSYSNQTSFSFGCGNTSLELQKKNQYNSFTNNYSTASFHFGNGSTEPDRSQIVINNENIETKSSISSSFNSYSNWNSFDFGSSGQAAQSMHNSLMNNQTRSSFQFGSGNTRPDQSQFVMNNANSNETTFSNKNEKNETQTLTQSSFNQYSNQNPFIFGSANTNLEPATQNIHNLISANHNASSFHFGSVNASPEPSVSSNGFPILSDASASIWKKGQEASNAPFSTWSWGSMSKKSDSNAKSSWGFG